MLAGIYSIPVRRELTISAAFEIDRQSVLDTEWRWLISMEQGANRAELVSSVRARQRVPETKHFDCAGRCCCSVWQQSDFVVTWKYRLQHRTVGLYSKLGYASTVEDNQRQNRIRWRTLHHLRTSCVEINRASVRVRDQPRPQASRKFSWRVLPRNWVQNTSRLIIYAECQLRTYHEPHLQDFLHLQLSKW